MLVREVTSERVHYAQDACSGSTALNVDNVQMLSHFVISNACQEVGFCQQVMCCDFTGAFVPPTKPKRRQAEDGPRLIAEAHLMLLLLLLIHSCHILMLLALVKQLIGKLFPACHSIDNRSQVQWLLPLKQQVHPT